MVYHLTRLIWSKFCATANWLNHSASTSLKRAVIISAYGTTRFMRRGRCGLLKAQKINAAVDENAMRADRLLSIRLLLQIYRRMTAYDPISFQFRRNPRSDDL